MGIITSLVRPEARATIEGPLPLTAQRIVEWLAGPATASGIRVSTEGSLRLIGVWACVRVISEDVASLPLLCYNRLERGKERIPQHPLYRLLHESPNPYMTSTAFREALQGHVLLWGNAYASIERDEMTGRPMALWPLRPDRMDAPVISDAGTLLYTYHLPTGEPRSLTQSEVFHLRGLSSDGITGYSPITLHREGLAWSIATREYGARFFGNDSRPGGILQAKNRLSDEAVKRLRESWETAHRGLEQSHRIGVLEEGIEWKQTGIPPEDAQYLEVMTFQLQDIARIYRTPPHKIGDLSRATYSNIEEQAIEYVSDTLRPWLVRWEQQANKDLVMPSERGRVFVEHLMDALLRGKTLERFQAYQLGLQNGVYSPNEIREFENLNPFEGGDTHLQQVNMAPYGTAPAPAPARMKRSLQRTDNGYEMIEEPVHE